MINLKQMLTEDSNSKEKLGCLMAEVEKSTCKSIVDFGKKIIKEDDLYHEINKEGKDEYGREYECHVTIRYGFLRDLNELEVRHLLKDQKPFVVELYELNKFDSDPNFDVIMIKVKSPILNKLNELSGVYPNKTDYPEYHPHLTLGYVKKGKFEEIKRDLKLSVVIETVCYSPIDGGKSYFELK